MTVCFPLNSHCPRLIPREKGYLLECGPAIRRLFQHGLHRWSKDVFHSLVLLANERILAYPYAQVPPCLRQLYSDASLMKALAALQSEPLSEHDLLDLIKGCDMAIVVAGTPGQGRRQAALDLIAHLQALLPCSSDEPQDARLALFPTKAPRVLQPIPTRTLDTAPSMEDYLSAAHTKPFIIKGGIAFWPACTQWPSLAYLRRISGRGRVVPVEVGGTYTQSTWSQTMMEFWQFLDCLCTSDHPVASTDMLYLAQHDLMRQFPQLEQDIVPPDYVYMSPGESKDVPAYVPPVCAKGYLTNIWLGPKGTDSPAHTDPYFNAYAATAQVVGRKYIWVAPPDAPGMYPFSSTSTPDHPNTSKDPEAGSDSEDEGERAGASAAQQYMSNTSQLDVIAASLDPSAQDRERFPDFFQRALPRAQQAVLEPGDLLLMPVGWWHALKALDASCSVSMWF